MTGLNEVSTSSQSAGTGSRRIRQLALFWLKNRRPDRWRDVQQLQGDVGHYLISDRPLTEEQWIEERTKLTAKDVTPAVPQLEGDTGKPSNSNDIEE